MTYQYEHKRAGSGAWEMGVAGETLGARKLVYLDNSGVWKLADADYVTAFPVVGITLEAINNGNSGRILTCGYIGDASWSWGTLGNPIYATSVAGELSQTEPLDGVKNQIIALARKSDLIYFNTGLNQQAKRFYSNSYNWDDLRFPMSSIKVDPTNPPSSQAYKSGLVLSYSSTTDNVAYVTAQLPHTWQEETVITPHLHWTIPTSGSAGAAENVKWDLTYSWANVGGSFPDATTDTITVDVKDIAAHKHLYTEFAGLDTTDKAYSSMLIISIARDKDVANDYAYGSYLVEFDIHYMKNRFGTIEETP